MVSLEQVRVLNGKVQKALEVINGLRSENGMLRNKLGEYEKRMEELETLVNSFNQDQDDIETGILGILQQLDKLEEDFYGQAAEKPAPAAEIAEEKPSPEPVKVPEVNPEAEIAPAIAKEEPQTAGVSPNSGEAELDIF